MDLLKVKRNALQEYIRTIGVFIGKFLEKIVSWKKELECMVINDLVHH